MYRHRSILLALACALGLAAGPAFAHSGGDTSAYGGMPMMGGGGMMGFGTGGMMGPGPGAMMGGTAAAGAPRLSDDRLDQIGDRIAARYQLMQQIAQQDDKAARRDLVRQYVGKMHGYRDDDADHDYGSMGYGMMGPGMMGYGRMGNGAMRYRGMDPAMMHPGRLSDEQLDGMAEHMAEGYKDMQELAQTTDKAERRKLMREHFKEMQQFWQNQ